MTSSLLHRNRRCSRQSPFQKLNNQSRSTPVSVCKRASGFTLVEMIVAITILSLISLATLTGVRTLGDSQKKLEDVTGRLDQMRLVSDFLRNSLRQATSSGGGNSGSGSGWGGLNAWWTEQSYFFYGSDDELIWAAPLEGAEGVSGLQYTRLSRDGGSLRIQFIPYRPGADDLRWEAAVSHPLVESLNEIRIDYRETLTSDWVPNWDQEENGIPRLVRVRIQAHERYWPDIVVAPPHDGDSG